MKKHGEENVKYKIWDEIKGSLPYTYTYVIQREMLTTFNFENHI